MLELNKIAHFVEKHAKRDAESENNSGCNELLDNIHKDLTNYVSKLHEELTKLKE